ncbi:MAG: putative cytokinetic ring protein SteA [Bacillota bacterium]|nr:putative cytokinetic ring protein SteA [Bacillota bacterium]
MGSPERVAGVARVDRRTKRLAKRIRPGEVAIIDHVDLDEVSAESLVSARVRAVVNASPSISGRYPNLGPAVLAEGGVLLFDALTPGVMDLVGEGDEIEILGTTLYRRGEAVAQLERLSPPRIKERMAVARAHLSEELDRFVENTLEYAKREKGLILGDIPLPEVAAPLKGRHALVVVRGSDYREDLAAIRGYIEEMRPVLIGVDGGADALLEEGYRPDLIVGDMDSVSDKALLSGAEIVVHAYPDGRAPGLDRIERLKVAAKTFPVPGTSEDAALLLAHGKGAALIVAVGTHSNMIDFLEKGRSGMASTFLVRLKVGSILVDAKGVNKLYRGRLRLRYLVQIGLAALIPVLVVIGLSEPIQRIGRGTLVHLRSLLRL